MSDRDVSAIASWERNEERAASRYSSPGHSAPSGGYPYVCTGCDWTGRGETALKHYRSTGHAIRGRNWPAGWPDCQWSIPPFAIFAFDWPGVGPQYHIVGGVRDKSTVTAETLLELGIEVRK